MRGWGPPDLAQLDLSSCQMLEAVTLEFIFSDDGDIKTVWVGMLAVLTSLPTAVDSLRVTIKFTLAAEKYVDDAPIEQMFSDTNWSAVKQVFKDFQTWSLTIVIGTPLGISLSKTHKKMIKGSLSKSGVAKYEMVEEISLKPEPRGYDLK